MTAALCLSGQLRCFKQAYPSIKEHLIDPLKADVYGSFWNYLLPDERNQQDGTLDEFIELYRPVRLESFPYDDGRHKTFSASPLRQYAAEGVHVDRILAMWCRIERCLALTNDTRYDFYIRCRCDLKFLTPIPENEIETVLKWSQIGIPFCNYFNTFRNDQFAFGPFSAMERYVKTAESMEDFTKRGFKIHPEELLFWHLNRYDIYTQPSRIQYRVLRPWGEENPCVTEACSSRS